MKVLSTFTTIRICRLLDSMYEFLKRDLVLTHLSSIFFFTPPPPLPPPPGKVRKPKFGLKWINLNKKNVKKLIMVAIYLSFASFGKVELQDLSLGITSILRVFYFDSVTLGRGD